MSRKHEGGAPLNNGQIKKEIKRYLSGDCPVNPETLRYTRFKVANLKQWINGLDCDEIDACPAVGEDGNPKIVFQQVKGLQFSKDPGDDDGFNFGTTCPPFCDPPPSNDD